MTDHMTILLCRPRARMTKTWRHVDGVPTCTNYSQAAWFRVYRNQIDNFEMMASLLGFLADKPRACVIRGVPKPETSWSDTRRRKCHFAPEPHRWLLLDFDGIEETIDVDPYDGDEGACYLRTLLPAPFHNARCWWSHTSSAGFKPGMRMRLAFWLDRRTSDAELKQWLCSSPVDLALFHEIQVHYVASPMLVDLSDPIEQRSGVLDGDENVAVPEIKIAKPNRAFQRSMRCTLNTSGKPFEDAMAMIIRAIMSTEPAGPHPWGGTGRHHALFCGSLAATHIVRRFILNAGDFDDMAEFTQGVFNLLAAAGAAAGIEPAAEIERTINNAWRVGGLA